MALPYALLYGTVTTRISSCARRLMSGDVTGLPVLKHKVMHLLLADGGRSCSCSYNADNVAAHAAW